MDPITFKVHGMPVVKSRPRFARQGKFITTYTPKATRDAENAFLAQAVAYKPAKPIAGAIAVNISFVMVKPASKPKKVLYWTTRPDLDNLLKLLDSLNGVFWLDDSQIVNVNAEKKYGDSAYTEITINPLEYI